MTSKKANWLFLTIILVHFGVVAFLLFAGEHISFGIVMNFLVSQGIVVVPALLFWLVFERGYRRTDLNPAMAGAAPFPAPMPGRALAPVPVEAAAFRRIKITSLLMIALCTLLIMPLVTVLNALSMFFTDNAMAAMEGDILATPFLVMLFMIGIFGPFCEEFVFRGVLYRSYARSAGGGIKAVLLSALLFGLMHMNFNQAIYAFGIGIFLALLVEAAGSLWASVFCHMFFNSLQVVLMYLSGFILDSVYGQAVSETAQEITTQELMAALSVYLVIAAVTTPIAVCIIFWISKNEGRPEVLKNLFSGRRGRKLVNAQPVLQGDLMPQVPPSDPSEPLLSVPLIIAVVLCLGYMSLELFLL